MEKENLSKGIEIERKIQLLKKELEKLERLSKSDIIIKEEQNGHYAFERKSDASKQIEGLVEKVDSNIKIFGILMEQTFKAEIERLEKELKAL